jgi:hypothetical protein
MQKAIQIVPDAQTSRLIVHICLLFFGSTGFKQFEWELGQQKINTILVTLDQILLCLVDLKPKWVNPDGFFGFMARKGSKELVKSGIGKSQKKFWIQQQPEANCKGMEIWRITRLKCVCSVNQLGYQVRKTRLEQTFSPG